MRKVEAYLPLTSNAPSRDALIGKTLGHHRILEKIGAGGMGEVYRAQDEHRERAVAMKVLSPGTLSDDSSRKRFRKEPLAPSKLNHPNIATIHDFDMQKFCYNSLSPWYKNSGKPGGAWWNFKSLAMPQPPLSTDSSTHKELRFKFTEGK